MKGFEVGMSRLAGEEKEVDVEAEAEGEGCSVLDVMESSVSVSSFGDGVRDFSAGSAEGGRCRERMVWVMWLWENGLCGVEGKGFDHASTVSRTALVISSWLVYGMQTFSRTSSFPAVSRSAFSTASRNS